MKIAARWLVICALAAPTAAVAQIDASAGQILCRAWTKSSDSDSPSEQEQHAMMIQWTFGFLIGQAILNDRIKAGVARANDDGIVRWVDDYCRAHPLNSIQQAADKFALESFNNSN